jgi:peptidoglycan/xylan/chitin deacetylase (PgdA/CDA1 family)
MSTLSPVGGVLSLTFDNLGEAAELEMGALAADAPLGRHETALEVVPRLLGLLEERGLAATFFVEGLNAELYPDLLREIDARGHEVAYHAWRHETWAELTAAEQAANLERGIAAFERLGLEIAGLRPPGGQLGEGGTRVLREAGLRYCSPAGAGMGFEDGVALLPFGWRHLDASCLLPPFAAVREQINGSADPIEPAGFAAWLEAEIDRLAEDGGYMAIILHPFMLGWLGEERLGALLDRIAGAAAKDEVWVAPCGEVAEHVSADPERFGNGTVLDSTSWT